MKTLKKTLCLVLALVMVVGTLAFAASADVAKPVDNFANYKDAETAKASAYAEAIDVNLGLGIIKGVSKTEIKIDGTLTRAQAAKIVCYLLLGEDIAEKLAPASSFDDVAETMWASKYIAYAASEGILNGKGNNKFDPNGEVTGYEFEKILLNALNFGFTNIQNYDPITGDVIPGKKNNYTGSNWKTKVSLDAADVELGYGAYGYGTALEGADLNKAKEILAFETTKMVHGEEEAVKAQQAARALFGGGTDSDNIPTTVLEDGDFTDGGINIVDLLVKASLAPSKSEARRNVTQGGVTVDGEKIADTAAVITKEEIASKGEIVVKRGKKSFRKIKI